MQTHYRFIGLLVPVVVLGTVLCGCDSEPSTPENAVSSRPDDLRPPERVFFVLVDTLRADHLGFMGYERETSPYIDSLANKGVVFRSAFSTSHVTPRSVAAIFTGHYFSQLQADTLRGTLPEWPLTLAEHLEDHDFRTEGWILHPTLGKKQGFAQGFEDWHMIAPRSVVKADLREGVDYIREHYERGRGPEFHYVHTFDAHFPYRPPIPFDRLWAPQPYTRNVVREGNPYDKNGRIVFSTLPFYADENDVTQEDIDFLVAQYDGTIRYTDEAFPELLAAFDFDSSRDLLVFMADHGEQFFEHGFFGHDKNLYLEEIHVPLFFVYDGFPAAEIDDPVSLADLFPTLCDLLSLPVPEGLAGESLLPLLLGEKRPDRVVFSETRDPRGPIGAVIDRQYYYGINTAVGKTYPWRVWPCEEELYDWRKDPWCLRNIVQGADSETLEKLNAALRAENLRYVQFERSAIQGSEATMEFGPNLLASLPSSGLGAPGPLLLDSGQGKEPGLQFSAAPARAVFPVQTKPRSPYLLEFDYTLESGVLCLELRSAEGEGEYWYEHWGHEIHAATNGRASFRVIVYPLTANQNLAIELKGAGRACVYSPKLRAVLKPDLQVVPLVTEEGERTKEIELSADEMERLRALGYLSD